MSGRIPIFKNPLFKRDAPTNVWTESTDYILIKINEIKKRHLILLDQLEQIYMSTIDDGMDSVGKFIDILERMHIFNITSITNDTGLTYKQIYDQLEILTFPHVYNELIEEIHEITMEWDIMSQKYEYMMIFNNRYRLFPKRYISPTKYPGEVHIPDNAYDEYSDSINENLTRIIVDNYNSGDLTSLYYLTPEYIAKVSQEEVTECMRNKVKRFLEYHGVPSHGMG